MIDISTKFAGLNLKSPIIVGSSSMSSKVNNLKKFEDAGAGAIVLKSIFEEEIVFEYNKYLSEAEKYGYDNENLDYFDYKIKQDNLDSYIKLIKTAKSTVNIPIIASVNCISTHEWTYFTKKIEEAGADALELNIFILPSDFSKTSEKIENTYIKIIKEVRKKTKLPLIVKMSSFFTALGNMIQKISKLGVDGIVLFNRYYNPDIDIKTQKIINAPIYSTPEEIRFPLRWIALSSGKVDCSLAASTGVHDGEAMIKMILAGADAVEIVSTIFKNGAKQITKMNEELTNYLHDRELESILQIKGLANQMNVKNPALFERVQFMKYFSDNKKDIL